MSAQGLAEALLKMLSEEDVAEAVKAGDLSSLSHLSLSQEERDALVQKINRWEFGLVEVGTVGAWGLLAKNIDQVTQSTKDQLNRALAARQTFGPAVPVTGS
jgi:hypothetical protein